MKRYSLKSRHAKEALFSWSVVGVFCFVVLILMTILTSLTIQAFPVLWRVDIKITFDAPFSQDQTDEKLEEAFERLLPEDLLNDPLFFVEDYISFVGSRIVKRTLSDSQENYPMTVWLPATENVAHLFDDQLVMLNKDKERFFQSVLEELKQQGRIASRFNMSFFTSSDSREAENAGIAGALVGSFYCFLLTVLLSVPLGILTGIYLQEFAPRNMFFTMINSSINNLAAVPSIIFGIMGVAVFINFLGIPRSTALLGGIILALMTLPTIIIVTQASLVRVPQQLKDATIALGATHLQMVFLKALPCAMPGILTGVIIGIAQALGETAPLIMIGMLAFIPYISTAIDEPITSLPVQIYLWSSNPEQGFIAKTAGAILVLLFFIFMMNSAVMFLRHRMGK